VAMFQSIKCVMTVIMISRKSAFLPPVCDDGLETQTSKL
jgi:hypothetical protein